jgi:DNA-binding CsgD family transcriptional regulator
MTTPKVEPIRLTPRETEILAFVLRGESNKVIAARLGVSEQAVKEHVSRLMRKLEVPNRAALAEAGSRIELTGGLGIDRNWMRQLFREADAEISIMRGPELRYEAANKAFRRAARDRSLLGRPMREAFPEFAGQGIFERVERVYATGEPDLWHELTWNRDRGQGVERRYVDLMLQPLRGEDRKVNGILSFAFDVTDPVNERARRTVGREEFAVVLDLVPSGVIVTDEVGRITTLNSAAQRIVGTPLVLSGSTQAQAVGPQDAAGEPRAVAALPVARALRGETLSSEDVRLVGGEPPHEVVVRSSVRPLRDVDGRISGTILVFSTPDAAAG